MCMIYTVIINVSLICYTNPFSSGRFAKYTEMFNEVVMMLIMYTNLCFTDFDLIQFTDSVLGTLL